MNKCPTNACVAMLALLCALSPSVRAADALLKLPDFDALTEKAEKSVTITLDPALLRLASSLSRSERA